jgi:hydroxyacylglutathione hydrolase
MRMGYDNLGGYLVPSMVSWYKEAMPLKHLNLMTVTDLKEKIDVIEGWQVLDVRSIEEREEGHIEGSMHIYIGLLEKSVGEVPKDVPIAVICKSGTRSGFASSILLRAGWTNIHNVLGGMGAWKKAGYPTIK